MNSMLRSFFRMAFALGVILLITACDNNKLGSEPKEILIYCGITMVKPITEIAKLMEAKENVKIHISQGGSKDLYNSLKQSQTGDLYLPGSSSYRDKNLQDGLLTDYALIGYNQAALMVKKGNPQGVQPSLEELLRKDLSVVLCNPESGSIGRETKKILTENQLYDQIMANTAFLNSDSRTLNNSLKNGNADVILNWRATAFFEDNKPHIDVIDLAPEIVKPKKLQLNLLRFSKHPEIARQFMTLAASEVGQAVFRKHGFLDKNRKAE